MKRLMLAILHSDTYLRDSRIGIVPRPADDCYAAAILKPLSGEQMAWSIAVATGYTDQLAKKFAKDVQPAPGLGTVNAALRVRWEKDLEFDPIVERFRSTSETFQANVSQALFATFNPFSQKLLEPKSSAFVQRLVAEIDNRNLARIAYLAVLSRSPSEDEVSDVAAHFAASKDRSRVAADLVWALLTTAEFRFNH